MRAFIVSKRCSGCGVCEYLCPGVFEMNGNTAEVWADPVPREAEAFAEQAAQECLPGAILVIDDGAPDLWQASRS